MALQGEDLNDKIAKSTCYCLNEASAGQYSHLFVGDHTLALRSDADEQLLIHIGFNQTVNLNHIVIGVPGDASCPRTLKLFANANQFGFSDASEQPPSQTVTLAPSTTATTVAVKLNAVKWKAVDSITIFVEDNHGSDFSSLHSLKMFGVPINGTDVSKISSGCSC